MAFFDDSHYRLGRVTNMDARSNKAMIELLENSIDELQDKINSGKYSGEELESMICELSTLQVRLTQQKKMKVVLDEEAKHVGEQKPITTPIGVFINNHNDYEDVMMEHISRILDDNFTGKISAKTAEKNIEAVKNRWLGSSEKKNIPSIPYTLSNGVQLQLDMGWDQIEMEAITKTCDNIARNKDLPIKAFKFGYSTYLKLMEGSNPIEKDDVKVQDFTMVSISYNVMNNGSIKVRPVYKFNIPVNGNTVYLSFIVCNGKATDVNWLTSLNRKKA